MNMRASHPWRGCLSSLAKRRIKSDSVMIPSNPPEGVVTAAVDMPWPASILATAATGVSGGIFVTFVAIKSRAYNVFITFHSPFDDICFPHRGSSIVAAQANSGLAGVKQQSSALLAQAENSLMMIRADNETFDEEACWRTRLRAY
jgi:hypothetical protein